MHCNAAPSWCLQTHSDSALQTMQLTLSPCRTGRWVYFDRLFSCARVLCKSAQRRVSVRQAAIPEARQRRRPGGGHARRGQRAAVAAGGVRRQGGVRDQRQRAPGRGRLQLLSELLRIMRNSCILGKDTDASMCWTEEWYERCHIPWSHQENQIREVETWTVIML